MNTRVAETRVGGRSRYPGRPALSPAADIGGSIAEAERLRRDGALPQARQVLGRAVDLASAVAGADPLELCTARRMLGEISCEMGDPQSAFQVLSALCPDAEKAFGPRHPASVRSLAVLAATVHELGDFNEAERLYQEVGERIGDQKSRAGSLVRVRLALVQRDRGNLDAARDQLSDAYQKHRDAFGTEDPDTVHIAAQLAEMHRDAGDSATARRVLTVAYVASCSSLGEEHELTRRLESDLEALEAPMPSAPVDLPEDTQSTRSIKRRHSKKGAASAPRRETTGPIPAPGHVTGPIPAPGHTTGPIPAPGHVTGPIPAPGHVTGPIPVPGHTTGPIPSMPAGPVSGGPAGPVSGGPAGPVSGGPAFPGGPSGHFAQVPPAARVAPVPPQPGPFTAGPRSSATAPPRGPGVYGAAGAAAPPAGPAAAAAAPPGVYGTRAGHVPGQARRRVLETDQGYGGRRTLRPNSPHSAPPGHGTYGEPLSPARLAALAAQETVIQNVVVDPVAAPPPAPRPERRKSGNGVRIAAIILMVIAVLAGIALAAIGVMVAG